MAFSDAVHLLCDNKLVLLNFNSHFSHRNMDKISEIRSIQQLIDFVLL